MCRRLRLPREKSALAVRYALHFGGEVISCDSMQVYKNMNIGTAKTTEPEMKGVAHHLIDILDINQNSASRIMSALLRIVCQTCKTGVSFLGFLRRDRLVY